MKRKQWENWREQLDIEHPYPKGDFLLSKPDKIWRDDVVAFIKILLNIKRGQIEKSIDEQVNFGIRERVITRTILRNVL